MSRKCWILTVLIFSTVLLFQVGCQEETKAKKPAETQNTQALLPESPVLTDKAAPITKPLPEEIKETSTVTLAADANGPLPEIKMEKNIHDFGNVSPSSNNVCEFKFTNVGKGVLKILDVTKTCGCTPFTLEKKEYLPGESGTLKVSYNAAKTAGPVTRYLFMKTNDPANAKVELTIKATITLKIDYEPKKITFSLNDPNVTSPDIIISSSDGQPFSITGFKSQQTDAITANYDLSKEDKRFVLKPKVDASKLTEGLRGTIDIDLTHPEARKIAIPFEVLPQFNVTPPSLLLFDAKPQTPVIREMWILNNYGRDFEIESVHSEKGLVKVLKQEKVDKRFKLELEITPPVSDEIIKFSDTIMVKIKDGKELKVTCNGFYAKQARNQSSRPSEHEAPKSDLVKPE